jgi:hypothetical protein
MRERRNLTRKPDAARGESAANPAEDNDMPGGTTQVQDEGLVRAIGVGALGVGIFNLTLGAGIFALPGVVAAELGPAALLAYLVCAGAVALVIMCFAEVGSRVTRSGGSYAYIEEALGPFAGFIASTLMWFGWGVLGSAAIIASMTDMLALMLPVLHEPLLRALFIVVLMAFLAWTNIRGAIGRQHRHGVGDPVLCVRRSGNRARRQRRGAQSRAHGPARAAAGAEHHPHAVHRPADRRSGSAR